VKRPARVSTTAVETETVPDSFTAGNYLMTEGGRKVPKYCSVAKACAILGGFDREVIYTLIHAKVISAYSRPLNPAPARRMQIPRIQGR